MKAIFFVIALLGVLVWQSARVHGGVLPPPAEPEPTVWNNDPVEEDVYVDCPCGYALYRVRSEFSDGNADRQWLWECRKIRAHDSVKLKENCEWTGYINGLQEHIVFRCPKNEYMAGIRSSFTTDDRVWNVKCCKTVGICLYDCFLSYCINDFEEYIDYCAEEDSAFVGLYSRYGTRSGSEVDRQWWIEECRVAKCQFAPGIELESDDVEEEEESDPERDTP